MSPNLLHGASFAGKLGLGLTGGLGLNGVRIPLWKIISLVYMHIVRLIDN